MSKPRSRPAPNRRGSKEAIEKRRAARAFNDALIERTGLDGRTEKRRKRLLEELESGVKRSNGTELKPVEVLLHANELLDLGETLATLKKTCRVRKPAPNSPGMAEMVKRLHRAYEFRPETYRFVGVADEVLRTAGVLGAKRRSSAKRSE